MADLERRRAVVHEMRAGAKAVAPMLLGVAPFGLVAGATPTTGGLGGGAAIGLSSIVFAGASQLAAADVLIDGGGALVAIIAACTINLRLVLYSASLAPHLAGEPLRHRLAAAYVLTDQAYAVSIARWQRHGDDPRLRLPFYFGGALLLWSSWQACTVIGVVVGPAVPEEVPLDFAIPLVFLVLLVPVLTTRPAVVAAAVGGLVAVGVAESGGSNMSIVAGALAGIVAGTASERALEGPARREPPPDPAPPGEAAP